MANVTLTRFAYLEDATIGILEADDFTCFTLENPWLENKVNISCIPEGEYSCDEFDGNKYKGVIEITDVVDRTAILFHAGNYPRETQGCILVGSGYDLSAPSVSYSKNTLAELIEKIGREFELEIKSSRAVLD